MKKKLKRITRKRFLTPAEVAEYKRIRRLIVKEFPPKTKKARQIELS
jgi:hypothetical protein